MLTRPTSKRLRSLGLVATAQALEEQERQLNVDGLCFDVCLPLQVEREATGRIDRAPNHVSSWRHLGPSARSASLTRMRRMPMPCSPR